MENVQLFQCSVVELVEINIQKRVQQTTRKKLLVDAVPFFDAPLESEHSARREHLNPFGFKMLGF